MGADALVNGSEVCGCLMPFSPTRNQGCLESLGFHIWSQRTEGRPATPRAETRMHPTIGGGVVLEGTSLADAL